MSQSNYNIPNQSAPAVRAQLNAVFGSIATNNSGSTAPSTTFAYQWWYDTSTNLLKMRNAANSAWIDIALFDQTGGTFRILSDVASQAEAETGTDNTKLMTPLRTKDAFVAQEQQVGVGQTWQTPARAADTDYQNTTGKPIMVSVFAGAGIFKAGVSTAAYFDVAQNDGGVNGRTVGVIVPDSHYYRYQLTAGSIYFWRELR